MARKRDTAPSLATPSISYGQSKEFPFLAVKLSNERAKRFFKGVIRRDVAMERFEDRHGAENARNVDPEEFGFHDTLMGS